jgi:serine/threonine protein kinase
MIQLQGTYVCDRQLIMALTPVANGGDLAAYLTEALECGLEREQEVVLNRAFGCLASGLAHIHKHTIRHKDIKPQNILIHDGRVIYTDFGLSFDADQQDTTTIGYPGAFTRRYCAPEVQDHANRNRKSDVWCLGCVFVEILDVLEPDIGLRSMDGVSYGDKIDEVRRKLKTCITNRTRKELLDVCYDMMDPDQESRIETSTVLSRISKLDNRNNHSKGVLFCYECSTTTGSEGIATEEDQLDEFNELSLKEKPAIDTVSPEAETEDTTVGAAQNSAPITEVVRGKHAGPSQGVIISRSSRYHCTICGELGHKSSRCPNECWACNELYHKSADCPNKCWDCDEVGHYARDCPNKCWDCDEVGHYARDCPNKCPTCDEVGHRAKDCPNEGPDECDACGKSGHATNECSLLKKCWDCGKTGHLRNDCDDACFNCKSGC